MPTSEWPLKELVEVEWVDSCTFGRWRPKAEYAAAEPAHCRTAGYLLKADKQCVTIVQSMGRDMVEPISDSMTIPRGCVTRIRRLGRTR